MVNVIYAFINFSYTDTNAITFLLAISVGYTGTLKISVHAVYTIQHGSVVGLCS